MIFHELQRCSIISKILDRQYSLYKKLSNMSCDDAIVKMVMDMFDDSLMLEYYKNLYDNNGLREMEEREKRIRTSQNSMCKRYCYFDLLKDSQVYNSMISDYYRVPISRWRLSNHRLEIEVGRYTKPKTPRSDRVCTLCNVIEDEEHVVYTCPRYQQLREKYSHVTEENDIKKFLNPPYLHIQDTANFIRDIELRREELKLHH